MFVKGEEGYGMIGLTGGEGLEGHGDVVFFVFYTLNVTDIFFVPISVQAWSVSLH
jgi:hypothetical protein